MGRQIRISHLLTATAVCCAVARFLPGLLRRYPGLSIAARVPSIVAQLAVLAFPGFVLALGAAAWRRSRLCFQLALTGLVIGIGMAPAAEGDWNPGHDWSAMFASSNAEAMTLYGALGAGVGVAGYLWWQARQANR